MFNLQIPFSRLFRWLVGIFMLMFVLRLIYGYFYPGVARDSAVFSGLEISSSGGDFRKNYASEKLKLGGFQQEPNQPAKGPVSQKYEKVATLQSKSTQFERDEQSVRDKIKAYKAVIQYEQNIGNPGNRQLQLMIGVKPERLDSFYVELQQIGKILSRQITKTDKTNEYLQLNAKRVSLEKTRDALIELKKRGGEIDDYIGLANRILEVEGELQGLGVQLGNYDEENEFCTVRFSMQEGEEQKISFFTRVKVALEWTIKYYALLMAGLFFAALLALSVLSVLEKLSTKKSD